MARLSIFTQKTNYALVLPVNRITEQNKNLII